MYDSGVWYLVLVGMGVLQLDKFSKMFALIAHLIVHLIVHFLVELEVAS